MRHLQKKLVRAAAAGVVIMCMVVFAGVTGANSASVGTSVNIFGSCTSSGNGTSFASTSCVDSAAFGFVSASAQARAEIGSLGVGIFAELSTFGIAGNSLPSGAFSTRGRAVATFQDQIFINSGPQSGILRLIFNVDGEASGVVSQSGSTLPLQQPMVSAGIGINSVFNTPLSGNPTEVVDVPYTFGSKSLFVQLIGNSTCSNIFQHGQLSCVTSLDFLNSVSIATVLILDNNLNLIPDVVITSDSGFDYQAGFVAAVPLPAAFPLFGTGLAIMGFMGWRRRRKAQAA